MPSTPLSKSVTQRMLKQAAGSGSDELTRYLRAFGVTDVSLNRIPSVFKKEFSPEWKAFLNSNSELYGDPAQRALRATLSFIRYCQMLKIEPFVDNFTYKDPITGSGRLNVMTIRKMVMKSELDSIFKLLQSYVSKMRLSEMMRVMRTKVTSVRHRDEYQMVAVYVLDIQGARIDLDKALVSARGQLYTGDGLPPQLRKTMRDGKDLSPYADTLLSGIGTTGWYPVTRNTSFELYAIRARKDLLVLKAIVNLGRESKDNGDVSIKDRLAMWTKFKLFR